MGADPVTALLSVDVAPHPNQSSKSPAPWLPGEALDVYARLGVSNPEKTYVSFWLNVGNVSVVSAYEVVDLERLNLCLAEDCLARRLKLLLRAVKCSLPFPSKGAQDADF